MNELPEGFVLDNNDSGLPEGFSVDVTPPPAKQPKLKIPSTLAVMKQSAIKGAANLPDMFLNTPENLSNLARAGVGFMATEMGYPEYAPEPTFVMQNPVKGALEKTGVITSENEPVTKGQKVLGAATEGVVGGLLTGGRSVAGNIVNQAAGGTSAAVSQALANEGHPYLGLAAGLATAPAVMYAGNRLTGATINPMSKQDIDSSIDDAYKARGNAAPDAPTKAEFELAKNAAISELEKAGINFKDLSTKAKKNIIDYTIKSVAYKAKPKDIVEYARQQILEANPVPIKGTKGQLTQDAVQQQTERMTADNPIFGQTLRDKFKQDQVKLVENLDAIYSQSGGKIKSASEFGRGLRDFVSGEFAKTKGKVGAKYREAEATAGNLPIALEDSQIKFFQENLGDSNVSDLINKARNLGIVDVIDGKVIPKDTNFKTLYKLRAAASTQAKESMSSRGHYGGVLKGEIDRLFESYGSSLYKDAARARRQQGLTFESGPKSISTVIKKSTETDWAVPDEKLFNKIIVNGSNDDVKKLIDFSKSRGNNEQINGIRSMTAKYLKDEAVSSDGVSVSWSALERAVDRIGGREKLAAIYGKETSDKIMNIVDSARILNKQQPFAAAGSQTYGRLQIAGSALFKLIDAIPVIGGVKETAKSAYSAAKTAKQASNAMATNYGQLPAKPRPSPQDINFFTKNNLANALILNAMQAEQ